MTSRAQQVVDRVRLLDPHARGEFIDRVCAGDDALRAEVLAMLDREEGGVSVAPVPLGSEVGSDRVIGPYRLLQEIGEGGMGTVWMAEQREPVKRRVALKVIKLGLDSKQVVARFEAERQALALMDHPHIARVLDAGATAAGRPYFVMEYIRGVPVLEYCDRQKLDMRRRLLLFVDICHAIQHAHHKGIVHRDIKPSNVLVTLHDGNPVPKVIDFGVAKAMHGELTERTLFTEHRQMLGTPAYMSPEQAEMSGLDVDTRSDIYSLGVLLYELLTGTTPFSMGELLEGGIVEMVRRIREAEPPRPSTRVMTLGRDATTTALHRGECDLQRLGQHLRGDLDWIVMRCLEKDRSRRYQTANGLALDIGRYLADQPIEARPPSTGYRLRKFVQRHRGRVLAAATALLALVLGIAGTTWGLVWALDEKARADAAAEDSRLAAFAEQQARIEAQRSAGRAAAAEADAVARAAELAQVADFQAAQLRDLDAETMGLRLRADLLAAVRQVAEHERLEPAAVEARVAETERDIRGADWTGMAVRSLRDNVLRRARDAIEVEFAAQPLVQARLLQTVASTAMAQGLLDLADATQGKALAIRRQELGDDDPATIESMAALAELRAGQSRYDEALPLAREALARSRSALGDDHETTLVRISALAAMLGTMSRFGESEELSRERVERTQRLFGPDDKRTLEAMSARAIVLYQNDREDEARTAFQDLLERKRRVLGRNDRSTINTLGWLGIMLQRAGRGQEAEPLLREVLALERQRVGNEHTSTMSATNNLGWLLRSLRRYDEAEPLLREAMLARERLLGEAHQHTLASYRNLGQLCMETDRLDEAAQWTRRAVDGLQRTLGAHNSDTLWARHNLARILWRQEKFAEAEPLLREVRDGYQALYGAGHDTTRAVERDHASLCEQWKASGREAPRDG